MTQSTEPAQPAPQRGRGLRGLLLAAAFAATFVVGGVAGSVVPAAAQMEMGMAMEHGGGHGAMHAMMLAHLDKALDAVGASADQKARIETILKATMAQAMPHMAGGHEELMRILTAPTIDRAALEQARAARMAEADQASRAMVAGLADAAEVLTPEQRAHLATLMQEHRHHHHEMQP